MTPLLPKLFSAQLSRFEPLFANDITISIPTNLFLVAGGNGLGKTTLMQAVVYCIAGELDLAIEQDKRSRWGTTYFHDRLSDHTVATVAAGFSIGEHRVIIRRGFRSKTILNLTIDEDNCEGQHELEGLFEDFITHECGYQTFDDFRYVFHKLCYLPETRPNLAWDLDTQTRILMTLFSDAIDENQFRQKREDLKKLDSKRRHINVAINKARGQLSSLLSYEDDILETDDVEEELPSLAERIDINCVSEQLSEIYKERRDLSTKLRESTRMLSQSTSEVEQLENKLAEAREAFFLSRVSGLEKSEVKMAMHKLLFYRLCPACGSKANQLSQKAEMLVRENCCPLCGADEHPLVDVDLPQLDAELSEKIGRRVELEKQVLKLEALVARTNERESNLQSMLDKFRIARPIISDSYTPPAKEDGELQKELHSLENEYSEINVRFNKLQSELDDNYIAFHQSATSRVRRLRQAYEEYATFFLGVECDLEEAQSGDRFLDLNLFVPRFDGKTRVRPEMCSEAQRFFLDIAFRLALIDVTGQLSGSQSSFLCETPENALDISYIENVADMFRSFSEKGHTILLTTNIQPGGLAKPILRGKSKRDKRKSVLNLFDYGKLSDVQLKKRELLINEFNSIIDGG